MKVSLLSFSVGNFKSIREIQTLVFHSGSPSDKNVAPNPVTVLLGANASGKSNMLEALNFAIGAIRRSATAWLEDDIYFRNTVKPFLLDDHSNRRPSFFELDFVIDKTRYLYGFEYSHNGVEKEWMSYVPSKKWTPVFLRDPEAENPWEWNNSAVTKRQQRVLEQGGHRELALSLAGRSGTGMLATVANELSKGVSYLPLGDNKKDQRLSQLAHAMRDGKMKLSEVTMMMQAADTGIENVSIDEDNLPARLAELAKALTQTWTESQKEEGNAKPFSGFRISPEQGAYIEMSDENLKAIAFQLMFSHRGSDGTKPLKTVDQSDGTLTWLSAAPIIVDALRDGTIVVADELDSSLHSQLLGMVVKSFTDESININGAQLIFSSHDTNLLEHRKELGLPESSFWFVEKNSSGVSEFYPLTDFKSHVDANYERRYLSGRYGAIPHLSPALIRGLVVGHSSTDSSSHEGENHGN